MLFLGFKSLLVRLLTCMDRQIYVIAENKVLKINLLNPKTSEPSAEVFLSSEIYKEGQGEIIGAAVSTLSSSVFVNFRSRGLFAYTMRGQMLWSSGPVLDQFGYPQGCRKNVTDCYFSSVPLIDQCEASIYVRFAYSLCYSFFILLYYVICLHKGKSSGDCFLLLESCIC